MLKKTMLRNNDGTFKKNNCSWNKNNKGYKITNKKQEKLLNNKYAKKRREYRFCNCGCKQKFLCLFDSKQKFIHGHNSVGKKRIISLETRKKLSNTHKKLGTKPPSRKGYKEDTKHVQWRMKKIRKSLSNSPNITEQKLINLFKLLYINYIFTGDGSFWIERFNPDFVNKKYKKIIEFFGTYWHNNEESKKRDKRRLEIYKKHGYKTLIIKESELYNTNKCLNKILNFVKDEL